MYSRNLGPVAYILSKIWYGKSAEKETTTVGPSIVYFLTTQDSGKNTLFKSPGWLSLWQQAKENRNSQFVRKKGKNSD